MHLYGILILSLFYCSAMAKNLDSSLDPFSDRFIELANQKADTWTAGRNFPEGTTMDDLKMLLGALPVSESNLTTGFVHDIPEAFNDIENFDPREEWPDCPSLHEIRNQGGCGSCWAVSSASVMTDRTCIQSEGKVNVHYSSQDIVSCCYECGYGCDGGFPEKAFQYWENSGVVSGGPYGSSSGCMPYEMPDSSHRQNTPPCRTECREGYEIPIEEDRHYGRDIRTFRKQEKDMKYEIMMNGPVVASFDVYRDFFYYRKGVYQHRFGDFVGLHAIKILGFGVTKNNVKYWLCANSWGPEWGDTGFIKILRGTNECKIEQEIVTGSFLLEGDQ